MLPLRLAVSFMGLRWRLGLMTLGVAFLWRAPAACVIQAARCGSSAARRSRASAMVPAVGTATGCERTSTACRLKFRRFATAKTLDASTILRMVSRTSEASRGRAAEPAEVLHVEIDMQI